jgi:LCP family protein required for cell wall assembly
VSEPSSRDHRAVSAPESRVGSAAVLTRHGRLPTPTPLKSILKLVAISLAVVLVSGVSVASMAVQRLEASIDVVELVGTSDGPVPTVGAYPGGYNFLIVGSDTREGQGGIGGDESSELNDVTMLLHVSEDHTSAVAVSIPRDLVVPIPSCPDGEGGHYSAMSAQSINVSLSYGGLACTVLTVEALTGLDIQFAGLITFTGVIEMSNAVGGVDVCVSAPIDDPYSGLLIESAGTVTLQGSQALAFLRSRHGVGDASDLARISSQQVYLSSLVRTLKSNATLTNLPRLYSIASAATQNMTLSSNLKSLDTLVAVAQSLQNIPLERIVFVQYPGATGLDGIYANKVAPITAQADSLFELIADDEPFDLTDTTNIGSVPDPNAPAAADPSATAAPEAVTPDSAASDDPDTSSDAGVGDAALQTLSGLSGQSAAEYTCAAAR